MKTYKTISKFFNTVFIAVEDSNNNLTLGFFYINKNEYIKFSDSLNDSENNKKPTFKYLYEQRKTSVQNLASMLNISYDDLINEDAKAIVDMFNNVLKDKSYSITQERELIESNDLKEYKNVVNAYFKDKIIIYEKRSETFPFRKNNLTITSDKKINLRMYNVGQANLSALFVDEHPTFIFDLGRGRRCKDAEIMLNELSSYKDKRTTIVISHFDNDHINYADKLPDYGANLEFILPQLLNTSDIYRPNIQLLLAKMISNGGNVCFMLNIHINPIKYGPLTLLKGPKFKIDPNQSDNENSHGIATIINSHENEILIPGDMLYEDLGYAIKGNNTIFPTHVIIPHHGCEYSKCPIDSSIIDLSNLRESFVFSGPHYKYHHPNTTHLEYYSRKQIVRLVKNANKIGNIYNKKRPTADTICKTLDNPWYEWKL